MAGLRGKKMDLNRIEKPTLQLIKGGPATWDNSKSCAVSIAYVGGLADHADLALPLLTSLGIPATFYVSPSEVLNYAPGWMNFDTSLHELGVAPFETAEADGSLPNWPTTAIVSELQDANRFVRDFFGINSTGLAVRGDGSAHEYAGIQTVGHILTEREGSNTVQTNVLSLSSLPASKWPEYSKENQLELPNWTVIVFREIFGKSNAAILNHRMILESIRRSSRDVWIAPISQVVTELRMR